jgi:hypothetical protein
VTTARAYPAQVVKVILLCQPLSTAVFKSGSSMPQY